MSNASDFIIENSVLKKYVGPGGDVAIPEGVTEIQKKAFFQCKKLISVTMPFGVVSIGENAFANCENLITVTLPQSVTSIGKYAFFCCEKLDSVSLPDGVTVIGNGAFSLCKEISSIAIPAGVVTISNELFSDCRKLSYVDIPLGVTSIGRQAFRGCNCLSTIAIPETVTSIGDQAFEFCSKLTSIVLPDSLTSIGANAFYYCNSLTELTIPAGVTTLQQGMFGECKNLTSLTILGDMKVIEKDVFWECNALQTVIAPQTSWDVIKAAKIHFAATMGYLQHSEYYDDQHVGEYQKYLSSQKKKLLPILYSLDADWGIRCYAEAGKITAKNIDEEFLNPAQNAGATKCVAFLLDWKQRHVSPVDIEKQTLREMEKDPYAVTEMKKIWHYEVTPKDTVIITGYIGKEKDVVIPEQIGKRAVCEIGEWAFSPSMPNRRNEQATVLKNITSVTIPDSVKTIGKHAFYKCNALTELILGQGLREIGDEAFIACNGLTKVVIPEGVAKIGSRAFGACHNLQTIVVPDSVGYLNADMFDYCGNLVCVTVSSTHQNYQTAADGSLYSKDGKELICVPKSMCGSFSVPNGVTCISASAFSNCRYITEIGIPDSVQIIGKHAFVDCTSLENVCIPDSVATLPEGVFENCENLTTVSLPVNIQEIGESIFFGCHKLTAINIPEGLKRIPNHAFQGCWRLESIILPESVNAIDDCAFFACSDLKTVIGSNIWRINDTAFGHCSSLQCLTTPSFSIGTLKKLHLMRFAAIGFLCYRERYTNKDIITQYEEYIKANRKDLLEMVFRGDLSQALNYFIETGSLNARNCEKSFLSSAIAAKAEQCVTFLQQWLQNNVYTVLPQKEDSSTASKSPNSVAVLKKLFSFEKNGDGLIITAYKGQDEVVEVPEVIGKDTVIAIGDKAFSPVEIRAKNGDARRTLREVILPNTITSIGDYAFAYCVCLESVTLPESVKKIGDRVFMNSGLVHIVVPKCNKITDLAFLDCTKLKDVVISKGTRSVGFAFSRCTALEKISIPNSVKSIDRGVFYQCPNITIHAPVGSYAETYAKENNIPFVAE